MAAHTVDASGNFLVPNATFIAEFIAFLLILFILARYVYPVIRKPIEARQALDRQADRRRARSGGEAGRSPGRVPARADRGADPGRSDPRERARRGAEPIEELRASAREESARIVARGEELLANQRGAIVRELRGEIGSLAVELSEKIVNERLADDARVSATVDSFLAELERRDAAGSGT